MIRFHMKHWLNLFVDHRNKALTVAAIIVFVACRIFGPPWSFLGFAVLLGWLAFLTWLERRELLAFWDRVTNKKARRLADEAAIEGDTAMRAVELDTPEGDIQAATQLAAWNEQIGRLEAITAGGGKLDRAQELLLAQLHRDVRRVRGALDTRHATPESVGAMPMRLLGAVGAANPWAALLTNPVVLSALAFAIPAAWGGVQTLRLSHAKADEQRLEQRVEAFDHALATVTQQRDAFQATVTENASQTRALQTHLHTLETQAQEQQRKTAHARDQIAHNQPPDWSSLLGSDRSVRHDQPVSEPSPSPSGGGGERGSRPSGV